MNLAKAFVTIVLLFSSAGFAAAQESTYRNIAKLNLLSLPVRTLSVQYERGLSDNFSLTLSLNAAPTGSIPLKNFFALFVYDGDTISNTILQEGRVSHFSVTPEARYYFGKRPQSGFYVGGYLRYATSSIDINYVYDADGKSYPINAFLRGSSFGVGALLGAQFNLSERVVLDWWIAGASVNRTTIDLTGTVDLSELTEEEQRNAEDFIESDRFFSGAFDASVHQTGGNARGTITLPGFRIGLCLGYRF